MLAHTPETESRAEKTVELAAAVLMIEISLADDAIDDSERSMIQQQLKAEFSMTEAEVTELMKLAEQEADHAVSLHEFTRLLTDTLPMSQRINVLANLWRVALADNRLDKYEEYAIRKVSDLLYVSHTDFIKAKHSAQSEND